MFHKDLQNDFDFLGIVLLFYNIWKMVHNFNEKWFLYLLRQLHDFQNFRFLGSKNGIHAMYLM